MPNGKKKKSTRWQLTSVRRDSVRTDIRASKFFTAKFKGVFSTCPFSLFKNKGKKYDKRISN